MSSNISKRAAVTIKIECPLHAAIVEVVYKLQHPQLNPEGALNLGLAHNDLLHQKVFEKSRECLQLDPFDINYGTPQGSRQLRHLMQDFFVRYFHPHYPIEYSDIFAQTGAGASINQLLMAVADKGDYCMIPSPYYGNFDLDVTVNTGVEIYPVYLHPNLHDMSVDGDQLEAAYQQAKSEGKYITSILVTNPNNPVGKCYSKKDIETYLLFSSCHNIHIIFDEIYALSSFSHLLDENLPDPFISVLSLPYKDFIEPSLVHIVYGMSKDFAMNGFRVGFIVDQFNEPLRRTLLRSSVFSYISTITDRLLVNLFNDKEWVDDYLKENREALAANYTKTTEFLKLHNIGFIEADSSPFFLIDIRSFYSRPTTFKDEKILWHKMVNNGIYLAPGFVFHTQEPGYFRLTFALPWPVLEVGLTRLVKTLNDL